MLRKLLLSLDGAESCPAEFRIFAFGKTPTTQGDYSFDDESAQAVMLAAVEYGNRLTIDYEHMALADPPIPAPAAASFVPVLRDDGLWATDVRWTPRAAEMLRGKEYHYFSPAFLSDDTGRPSRLLNVALTNLPATKNMQPLIAAKQITEDTQMKTVITALSLKDGANEAEVLSAVSKISDDRKTLLNATGKETLGEALGVVAGWKIAADQNQALTTELNAVRAAKAQSDIAGLIDEATKDGRVAPAKRPEMEQLAAKHGMDALVACLSMLPKAQAPAIAPAPDQAAPADSGLTPAQLKIIKATGLSPEKFKEHVAVYRQIVNPSEEK